MKPFVNEGVFSLQARFWTLTMIASKNHGGRKAAGPEDPNDAIDDVKVVQNERFKDHSNTGELVIKIAESRPAPPTRRSSPHTSPFCARLGDATGAKIEATPDGRGEMTKELKKGSAQHDAKCETRTKNVHGTR